MRLAEREHGPVELDARTYELVTQLCAQGDELARHDDHRGAIARFNEAWQLLPEPKSDWHAATWILAGIADSGFLGGFLQTAREALDYVMRCPDAIGNPFLHLRRGQVLFEQGQLDGAADELTRAYMAEGEQIFTAEDAKYLNFLKTRIHT